MPDQTPEELELANLIAEALDLEDVSGCDIEPTAPLFDGGLDLDSIDALEIAVAIARHYNVHIKAEDERTRDIFASLRSLTSYVVEHDTSARTH